jgi:hypothetical protein
MMSVGGASDINVDELINLVETNMGSKKAKAIFIVDINFKIWGKKGEIPEEVLNYYQKFPLKEMHTGDTMHNESTYLMKVTEKTAVLIKVDDAHIARLSAINLKGRINALSPFYELEKYVEEKKQSKLNEIGKTARKMW